uniref:Decorin n=1 Tax=Lepisosteus oculatus TaxID=7918 RepID=W5NHY4_LEPOC
LYKNIHFELELQICWALPFRQSGFLDFMFEDGSGDITPTPTLDMQPPAGPVCPFRCQCHLRVIQCSDLGLKNVPEDIPSDTSLLDLKLQRLYLSKNLLKDMPVNMPKNLQELRIHENAITRIKRSSFEGMVNVIVMELGSNPLKSGGIENNAFLDLKRLSYIRISDTNITSLPKGLPSSLSELHLDGNKISKVDADTLKGLKNLAKLGLSFNEITTVENGSLANIPHLRELHLDNNLLTHVPPGLPEHKYIQVIYLHNNKIAAVGTEDFCPPGYNTKKAMYSGISLFSNPVPYWEVQPVTFRCVFDRSAIQLGNYRKK